MSGIGRVLEAAETLSGTPINVITTRCVRYRHKAASCRRCEQVCPAHALGFDEDLRPHVDSAACTSCGACAAVCPTGALEATRPAEGALAEEIVRNIATTGGVTLVCSQVRPVLAGAIPVGCLARADVSLLLSAAAHGATRVRLCPGACEVCASRSLAPLIRGVAYAARALLKDLGYETDLVMEVAGDAGGDESEEGTLSRKGFLRALAKGGASITSRATDAVAATFSALHAEDERLVRAAFPTHVPLARERLVYALADSPHPRITRANGFLFSTPEIDATLCQGCSMCAKVCPTGALAASREGTTFTLAFDAKACVSCYLCQDVCPKTAIARSEGTSLDALTGKAAVEVLTREHCEDPLAVSHDEKLSRLFSTFVNHA